MLPFTSSRFACRAPVSMRRISRKRPFAPRKANSTSCAIRRVKPWLFSILRNAYLHRARNERGQRCVSLGDMADFPDRLPDPLPEVEPERLQRFLDELPDAFRVPLVLYYFEELSYRDIAEEMDLPVGTVMSRLARAKAHLRSRLLQPPAEALADAPRRSSDGL